MNKIKKSYISYFTPRFAIAMIGFGVIVGAAIGYVVYFLGEYLNLSLSQRYLAAYSMFGMCVLMSIAEVIRRIYK